MVHNDTIGGTLLFITVVFLTLAFQQYFTMVGAAFLFSYFKTSRIF